MPVLLSTDTDVTPGDCDGCWCHLGASACEADARGSPGGGGGRARLLRRHLGPGAGEEVHHEGGAQTEAGAEAEAGV